MCRERNVDRDYSSVIAITNRKLVTGSFERQIERICQLGIKAVILREKDMKENEYESLAGKIKEICKNNNTAFYVHSFWKTAEKIGADGVHMPLPLLIRDYKMIRKTEISNIGGSAHSVEEALLCRKLGATYITASHIYETDCKKGLEPKGIDFLKNVCEISEIPVYALGGIKGDLSQLDELKACGAAGVCLMSAMMKI